MRKTIVAAAVGILLGLAVGVIPTDADAKSKKRPGCCKVCGAKSKPCGDSCISLKKGCDRGAGCAC